MIFSFFHSSFLLLKVKIKTGLLLMATIGPVKLPPMVALTSKDDISASLSGDPTIRVEEKGSLWASTGSDSSQWSVVLPREHRRYMLREIKIQ
jgi:hypothetical protein